MSSEINAAYKSVDVIDGCSDLTNKIRGALYDIAHSFVYIGFLLAECEAFETFKEWGYSSIHEYAFDQFGFKKSSTYNFINVCKVFSINSSNDVNSSLPFSMNMKDNYKDFNYSQLVEMLSMSEKQRSQVTPDMTVKQIREVKKSSDEPDYITLFNQQFTFKEFRYEFIKKIDNKKFRLLIKGLKVDVSDLWPDGYMLSIYTDFGNSGSGAGYQPFVDYEKFKDFIISIIPDSRRLEGVPEEASAPEVAAEIERDTIKNANFDLFEPHPSDICDLFNEIEEASLSSTGIDIPLSEIAMRIFQEHNYVIYKKSK